MVLLEIFVACFCAKKEKKRDPSTFFFLLLRNKHLLALFFSLNKKRVIPGCVYTSSANMYRASSNCVDRCDSDVDRGYEYSC